jgi:hypothetical protein
VNEGIYRARYVGNVVFSDFYGLIRRDEELERTK